MESRTTDRDKDVVEQIATVSEPGGVLGDSLTPTAHTMLTMLITGLFSPSLSNTLNIRLLSC